MPEFFRGFEKLSQMTHARASVGLGCRSVSDQANYSLGEGGGKLPLLCKSLIPTAVYFWIRACLEKLRRGFTCGRRRMTREDIPRQFRRVYLRGRRAVLVGISIALVRTVTTLTDKQREGGCDALNWLNSY